VGFDLATAKPVSSGFDLSTAKAVDETVVKPKTGVQHAADLAGVVTKHPLTSFAGLAENALSSVTGGAGSLADAVTGSDPGAHDWAYQPRTEAGKDLAALGGEEATKAGEKYDKYAGTGPLAQTIKERGQEAVGAVGTITALGGLRGIGRVGRVPGNGGFRPTPLRRPDVPGEVSAASAAPEAAAVAERASRLAPVSQEAPSKATLKSAARDLYKSAENGGVVISRDSFSTVQQTLTKDLQKQGLDATLHPDTTAALKRFNEETGPVTLEKLETLRRIAKDAESAQKPADQRLAGELVDAIDEFAEGLDTKDFHSGSPLAIAAQKQARGYWSRARKADTLDELVRRAELSAANFSGSGMENALRTEFRVLAKNKRRMRLFTSEEQAAIEHVAKGGRGENALRTLGKFAPTGVVSAILSGGAGAAVGGPIGAVALPVAGGISRALATRMTMSNVAKANQLVRRGPQVGPVRLAPSLTPREQIAEAMKAP
jgi:hypothetical protein